MRTKERGEVCLEAVVCDIFKSQLADLPWKGRRV